MSAADVTALLRLLATKGPPPVGAKAARALANPGDSQRVVNDLVAEVLGMEAPVPFTDEERAQLVAAIVPSAPPETDYDRGPFDSYLPRIRCRQDQADVLNQSMRDAGFSDLAKYVRFRLFA